MKEASMKDFWSSTSQHQQLISQSVETASPTTNPASTQNSPKLDIWRDPVWQSLGVIIGAVLTVVAILISLRQWQRKSLAYEVISNENIVRVSDNSVGSELQIVYQGKPVKDLYLITIKFINLGNTEIRPEDYVRPISLSFGARSEILGNKVLEQDPSNLDIKINHEKDKEVLLIDPVLLNKRDYFTIQALVTGFQSVTPNGRIAGVSRIREVTPLKLDSETLTAFVGASTAIVALLSSFLTVQTTFLSSEKLKDFIPLVLGLVLSILMAYVVNQLPAFKIKKK